MTPNNPMPMDATPIARRNSGLFEPGQTVTLNPKTKIATPMTASEIQAVLKRTLSVFIYRRSQIGTFLPQQTTSNFPVVAVATAVVSLGARARPFRADTY